MLRLYNLNHPRHWPGPPTGPVVARGSQPVQTFKSWTLRAGCTPGLRGKPAELARRRPEDGASAAGTRSGPGVVPCLLECSRVGKVIQVQVYRLTCFHGCMLVWAAKGPGPGA